MDLPQPYARTGDGLPVQLGGDCRDLFWFRSETLNSLYPSDVLEDFGRSQTVGALREWSRVVGPGALMVLLQPDQARYVEHCRRRGPKPNAHHSIDDFSLDDVRRAADEVGGIDLVDEYPVLDDQSFAVVFRKTRPTRRRPPPGVGKRPQNAAAAGNAARRRTVTPGKRRRHPGPRAGTLPFRFPAHRREWVWPEVRAEG